METKKVTRIPGTHYVKIDSSIYNTLPANTEPKKTVCLCLYCGEKFGGDANGNCSIYCKNCKKVENRRNQDKKNEEIRLENIAKGYKYAS